MQEVASPVWFPFMGKCFYLQEITMVGVATTVIRKSTYLQFIAARLQPASDAQICEGVGVKQCSVVVL